MVRLPISFSFVRRLQPALEAMTLGVILGTIDSNTADAGWIIRAAYLAAGAVLGLRHAGRALPCWPILGVSLYAVHVVAIALGKKPPYVEENYRFAEQNLLLIIPVGLSILCGVSLRVVLAASGSFRRKYGPPVRILPKSIREIVILVACLGVSLGCVRRVFSPPTIYAEGYDESKFRSIRVGMTQQEVISAMGQPLLKGPYSDSSEVWHYSKQYTYTSDFERRWLIFDGGKVQQVVNDYWYD